MCSTITLRKHIIRCLRLQFTNKSERIHRTNAAYQLAVCCRLGFGATQDDGNTSEWLTVAGKTLDDLERDVDIIRTRDTYHELDYRKDNMRILAKDGSFLVEVGFNRNGVAVHETELSLSRELQGMRQILVPTHWVVIRLQVELSRTFEDRGHYNQARSLLEETLQLLENEPKYGPSDPITLLVAVDLMRLLDSEGFYEGVRLGEKKLRICQQLWGDYSIQAANLQVGLASVHESRGLYQWSESLYRQGLKTKSELLGKRHPSTLTTLHDLGRMLIDLARYGEAEEVFNEVIEDLIATLGREHPYALNAIGSLASLLFQTDAFRQAEGLFRMQAAGIQDHWGEDYHNIPSIMNNLAMAINAQERYDEAEQIAREALAKAVGLFGCDCPGTLVKQSNLALILLNGKKYAESESILREVVPRQQTQLGMLHSNTLRSQMRLALAIRKQGHLDEARSLQSKILDTAHQFTANPKDHSYGLVKLRIHLSRTLQLMGTIEAAQQEIRGTLEGQAAILDLDHSDAYSVLIGLSWMLREDGFLEEAERYHVGAISKCEAELGGLHIQTLTAVYWLATHQMHSDRFSEAEVLLQKVSTGIGKLRGDDHWTTRRVHLLLKHWKTFVEGKQREAENGTTNEVES